MADTFEKRLCRNMVGIQSSLCVGEDLMGHLMQEGVLSFDLCEEVRESIPYAIVISLKEGGTRRKKAAILLDRLRTRGPDAEAAFIKALKATGQSHVADMLIQSGAKESFVPSRARPTPQPSAPHLSILNPTVNDDCDSNDPLIKFTLRGTPDELALRITSDMSNYAMTRSPRGRAIILNIVDYHGTSSDDISSSDSPGNKSYRTGADIDENNMKKLLEDLNFTTEIWHDVGTKQHLKLRLKKERNHEDHSNADAFIFVMMAHGEEGCIFLESGDRYEIKDIIKEFNGVKCESLIDKPKVFFIQACQGEKHTIGVTKSDGPLDGETESDALVGSEVKHAVAESADTYLAYATLPGFKAYRNTVHGSWFIRSVVEIFAKHVHEKHLGDLMTMVAHQVGKKIDDNGYKQCCRKDDTMMKFLYFLPGYPG